MSKEAAEHHQSAAEHHEHAARHHREAAKHHEAGDHELAAHHAHTAQGHLRTMLRRPQRRTWNIMAKRAKPSADSPSICRD
jgi:hypothetical protein